MYFTVKNTVVYFYCSVFYTTSVVYQNIHRSVYTVSTTNSCELKYRL